MGFYDGVAGTEIASAWAVAEARISQWCWCCARRAQRLTLAARCVAYSSFALAAILLGCCSTTARHHWRNISLQFCREKPVCQCLGTCPIVQKLNSPAGILDFGRPKRSATCGNAMKLWLRAWRDASIYRHCSLWPTGPQGIRISLRFLLLSRVCRIAVARDEAFCFYYEDNLDALRMNGAELVFFSPMRDAALPVNCGGVYLGGGYPELYLPELSANERMRTELCLAVLRGMPTVAECGGFLYLQSAMRAEDGRRWELVGVFPGEGFPTGGLRRFGYLTLTAETDSLLFKKASAALPTNFTIGIAMRTGKIFLRKNGTGALGAVGLPDRSCMRPFHICISGRTPIGTALRRRGCGVSLHAA